MFIPDAAAASFLDSTPLLDGELKDFDVRLKEAWDDTRFRLMSDSRKRGLNWAYDRYVDDIRQATGVRLDNPMVEPGGMRAGGELRISRRDHGATDDQELGARAMFSAPNSDQRIRDFHARVQQLAQEHPGLKVRTVDDLAGDISDEAKRRKAATESGANVGWGGFGGFLGQTGALMTDPINVMSMLVTGGGAAAAEPLAAMGLRGAALHFGKLAAVNGGIGMASETAIQPFVMSYNRDLGIDYTLGDAAESVGMAAIGGAGIGVGIDLLGRGVRASARGAWKAWRDARAKGHFPDGPEATAMDAQLGDAAMVEAANPFPQHGIAGEAAHGEATAKATADLLHGRPVEVDEITREVRQLDQAWDQVDFEPVGLTDDPVVAVRPTDIEAALNEVLVERGPVFERAAAADAPGEIVVKTPHMRGWGIVKFQWKHGAKSKTPPQFQIGKEHLLMFPRIIRELEPSKRFPEDNPTHWEWRLTEDNPQYGKRQIVWAVSHHDHTDGKSRLVSLYIQEPNRKGAGSPDSVRRAGAPESSSEVVSPTRDTAADLASRSEQSQGAPANPNIAPGAVSSKVSTLRERVAGLRQRLDAVEGELRRREGLGEPAPLDDPLRAERAALRADIQRTTRAAEKAPVPDMLRPPEKKPWRLAYWLARQGGLREDGGELAARDAAKAVPGLLNNKGGMDFDTAALRAWEAGYFHGDERPTINEFLDLLDHDLRSKRVFSRHDDDLAAAWDAHEQLRQEVDQLGIDARGMTNEELVSALHHAGRQQAERTARALDWEAAKALTDLDAALMKDARRLLDDIGDMELPVEVAELDGTPSARTRSARELLDEADAELQGLDAFRSCVLGG